MNDNEKINHDKLIGNIPELYDPEGINDNNYQYSEPNIGMTNNRKITNCPSIPETLITVPLCFWFNNWKCITLAALQYMEVEIHSELRSLYDLYLITDPGGNLYFKPSNDGDESGILKNNPMNEFKCTKTIIFECIYGHKLYFSDNTERKNLRIVLITFRQVFTTILLAIIIMLIFGTSTSS